MVGWIEDYAIVGDMQNTGVVPEMSAGACQARHIYEKSDC